MAAATQTAGGYPAATGEGGGHRGSGVQLAEGGEAAGPRRRGPHHPEQQTVDELAQETKRTSLLDRVELQLKGEPHVARLLFAFPVSDDRKSTTALEQEFNAWRKKQEEAEGGVVSGVLMIVQSSAVHFLEGPTKLLHEALAWFQALTPEVQEKSEGSGAAAASGGPRVSLMGPLRILYITELHGVRASRSWASYAHAGKVQSQGGQGTVMDDSNSAELIFTLYKKFLMACLRVRDMTEEDDDFETFQSCYKRAQDALPTAEEVMIMLGKTVPEHVFSYPEFEKVFLAPFQLVLHSELLWPMPPALSY